MKKHNFKDMTIWKRAMDLVVSIYQITENLPAKENFNLVSQINRCAVSIPSNIAEGSGRTTNKSFSNFLNFSLSSAFELETQLILLERIYKISTEQEQIELVELQKMIRAFNNQLI